MLKLDSVSLQLLNKIIANMAMLKISFYFGGTLDDIWYKLEHICLCKIMLHI